MAPVTPMSPFGPTAPGIAKLTISATAASATATMLNALLTPPPPPPLGEDIVGAGDIGAGCIPPYCGGIGACIG